MKIGKIIKTSAIIVTTVAATSLMTPTADANHMWGHYGRSTTWSTYGNQTYGSDGTTWSTYGNQSYGRSKSGKTRVCSSYGNQTYCN